MLNEEKIIGYFTKNYKKIGDDCAYLSQTKQLISTDTLVENTHFDLKYFTPKNIAIFLGVKYFKSKCVFSTRVSVEINCFV